ncbi:MAG TPA: type II secretion system protein [Pyrinomonadaceae bacterium]|jgi:general secretion pathway protein G
MIRQKEKVKRQKGESKPRSSFSFLLLPFAFPRRERGFSLLELIIVLTVLSILTIGVLPLVKISVKRQREQQLRETLREMRTAIEQFHRDTMGGPCSGAQQATNPTQGAVIQGQQPGDAGAGGQRQPQPYLDPRSNVMISDCTIFGVDNPDRYPPDLETLVKGVNILPRSGGAGGYGDPNTDATKLGGGSATGSALATKKKVYLRSIPVDPMTGEAEWDLRSSYDAKDAGSWGGENVFDVHSKSGGTALNGEKYSDW